MNSVSKNAIIIPAFNEALCIAQVVSEIRRVCSADIIVIDDGSIDDTASLAQAAGAMAIRHLFNLGYGAALQTGYKYCATRNYRFVLQMDADNQHDPRNIIDFFKAAESGQSDVIIGSRFLGVGNFEAGFAKLLAIRLFRVIIKIISGKKITDPTSGYQCLTSRVCRLFTHDSFPYDYPDANIIVMLLKNGFNVQEIPVTMLSNSEGRSMHRGLFNIARYFYKVFLAIFIALLRDKSFYHTNSHSGESSP